MACRVTENNTFAATASNSDALHSAVKALPTIHWLQVSNLLKIHIINVARSYCKLTCQRRRRQFLVKNYTHLKGIFIFCGWKKLFKDYLVNQKQPFLIRTHHKKMSLRTDFQIQLDTQISLNLVPKSPSIRFLSNTTSAINKLKVYQLWLLIFFLIPQSQATIPLSLPAFLIRQRLVNLFLLESAVLA